MKERIDRQTDENLYQPKVHSERIRGLYQIKVMTGIPMTVLIDLAIKEFLDNYQKRINEPMEIYDGKGTTQGE